MDFPGHVFDPTSATWGQRLSFVTELMREMSRKTDADELVRWYGERLRGHVLDRYLSVSRRGVDAPWVILARDSRWDAQPDVWRERGKLPRFDRGILSEIAYGGEVVIHQDLRLAPDDPAIEVLHDVRSLLAVPVFDGGEALNVAINVDHRPNRVDLDAVPYIVWLSNLFARSTHNLNLARELDEAHGELDREMKLIGSIQRELQPGILPEVPGLAVRTYYEPATRAGGDYYDVIPIGDEGRWIIVMADVSGHGAPAAVEMAITRTLVHEAAHRKLAPGETMEFVNTRLAERRNARGSFVTVLLGSWNPEASVIEFAIAGHPRPLLHRGESITLVDHDVSGPPLGLFSGMAYKQSTIPLRSGDRLVLYTDGVTEAATPAGELLGDERLHEFILACDCSARDAIQRIAADIERHRGGLPPTDDVTMMIVDR